MHFIILILLLQGQAPGKINVATGPTLDSVKTVHWHDFNENSLRQGRLSYKLIPSNGGQPLAITLSAEQVKGLLEGKVIETQPADSDLVVRLSYKAPEGKRAW